jgi:hypothetical protein
MDIDRTAVERGAHSMKIADNTGQLRSADWTPAAPGDVLNVTMRVQASAGSINARADLAFYDSAKALIGSVSTCVNAAPSTSGVWWTMRGTPITAPALTRYVKVVVYRSGSAGNLFINKVSIQPLKPAFHATMSTALTGVTSKASGGPLHFDTETFDWGGRYDNTAGSSGPPIRGYEFVVGEAGFYEFTAGCYVAGDSANLDKVQMFLYKNGAQWIAGPANTTSGTQDAGSDCIVHSGVQRMAPLDYVQVYVYGSTVSGTYGVVTTGAFFNGRLHEGD